MTLRSIEQETTKNPDETGSQRVPPRRRVVSCAATQFHSSKVLLDHGTRPHRLTDAERVAGTMEVAREAP